MFDLHIHSIHSDGTDSVEELIKNIKTAGIDYFSITDHDSAESAREIYESDYLKNLIHDNNLTYVPGIEFSCIFEGYKMHILGYDYNPELKELKEFEEEMKAILKEKNNYRFNGLKELGYTFSEKSKKYLNTKPNVRKLDFANLLVSENYFDNIGDAIKVINKVKSNNPYRLDGGKVVEILSKCGVKMVWAHSLHGLNEKPISFEEVEMLAGKLKKLGLSGLECYYSLYNEDEINKLIKIAERLDLFITCGSDYHGKNKTVKLAEFSTLVDDNKIKVKSIFKNVIY